MKMIMIVFYGKNDDEMLPIKGFQGFSQISPLSSVYCRSGGGRPICSCFTTMNMMTMMILMTMLSIMTMLILMTMVMTMMILMIMESIMTMLILMTMMIIIAGGSTVYDLSAAVSPEKSKSQ